MKRSSPARINRHRRRDEFKRCYHSQERVVFLQQLPCIVPGCVAAPCQNAHIHNGGMGRKADYTFTVPACAQHHHLLDNHLGRKKFEQLYHVDLAAEAIDTELRWQQHCAAQGEIAF